MPVPARRLPVPLLPTAVTLSGFLIHSFWPGLQVRFGLAPDSVIDDAITIGAGSAGWLGLAWLGVCVVDGLLRRLAGAHHTPAAPRLVSDLARVVFFGLAGVAVAGFVLHLPVTGLLATSGVLIAVLGFAYAASCPMSFPASRSMSSIPTGSAIGFRSAPEPAPLPSPDA